MDETSGTGDAELGENNIFIIEIGFHNGYHAILKVRK
jgi:hypothetical protein